ncbi:MAG: PhzF family phenazine biosynthesis protein [Pseudomonadota bacterium]
MAMRFEMVDVFANGAFSGNPVAVVLDADDIDPALFPQITPWFNLSETTFLLRPTHPDADYRARIFTLEREMPFAGHPTLGSCQAWLSTGGQPKRDGVVVQECGAGLVEIRQDAEDPARLSFKAPPLIRTGPVEAETLDRIVHQLQLDPVQIVSASWADNGPGWVAILMDSAEAVLAVEPQRHSPSRMDVGLVGPHSEGGEVGFELRAFFTDAFGAVVEDPVTGSLNASVAQWLRSSGRVASGYRAAQGTRIGREGRVDIDYAGDDTWVGGQVRTMFTGHSADWG